jgi:hypothetical protein
LWRRNGAPARKAEKVEYPSVCTADGCELPHSAKGYCSKHYARWVKYGSTKLPQKSKWACRVDGCNETKHKAKGFCRLHYERHIAEIKLTSPKKKIGKGANCVVDGCSEKSRAKQMCSVHYQRWKSHGDPLFVQNNRRERGQGKQWHEAPTGYIVRFEPSNPNAGPNGQVYQHRHVMSEMIGRPLRKGENVHHINGIKSDNRPENLELWTSSQPSGQRVTDIAKWAISVLTDGDIIDAAIRLEPSLADLLAKIPNRR